VTDEFADAKQKLTDLVAEIDPAVSIVIPARPTLDAFRISLTKGSNRRFISLSEDDMLDLVESASAETNTRAMLTAEIGALG
jgi:hypothetical protein